MLMQMRNRRRSSSNEPPREKTEEEKKQEEKIYKRTMAILVVLASIAFGIVTYSILEAPSIPRKCVKGHSEPRGPMMHFVCDKWEVQESP